MLLCVVAVFFIFNILAMVVNIFEVANILVDEMTRVSNLLVSVNSSVNFVIYCIFGDKFQRLFLRYFCYCYFCCRKRRPPQSGNDRENRKFHIFPYTIKHVTISRPTVSIEPYYLLFIWRAKLSRQSWLFRFCDGWQSRPSSSLRVLQSVEYRTRLVETLFR